MDADGDGVVDEILIGELSALHIFTVSTPRPVNILPDFANSSGEDLFTKVGCAESHVPSIDTYSRELPVAYPEVEADPYQNVFIEIDLKEDTAGFEESDTTNGAVVPMFSDLKRHDIGTFETTGSPLDNVFITPRLWGIADSPPYLHDGRALTLTDAILAHGVEAQTARDNFAGLDTLSLAPSAPPSDELPEGAPCAGGGGAMARRGAFHPRGGGGRARIPPLGKKGGQSGPLRASGPGFGNPGSGGKWTLLRIERLPRNPVPK